MSDKGKIALRVLAVIFAVIPAVFAVLPSLAAAGTVTISPVTGPPATTVAVTGTGFTATRTYTVFFGATAVATGTVPQGGTVNAYIAVPTVPRGSYEVTITTNAPDTTGAPIPTFTVTPVISLANNSGHIADQVAVSGYGFAASATVTIRFDGASVLQTTTNSAGTFSSAVITIPQTSGGAHNITASDLYGSSLAVVFTVMPKLTLSAASGVVGATITCSGTGFSSSSYISFTIDGVPFQTAVTSDTQGRFTSANLTVPTIAGGAHVVRAQDAAGNFATANITITSGIKLTPTSGIVGASVSISGNGFLANHALVITFDGGAITLTPATVSSEANGTFNANFKIPPGASGTRTITVSDGTNVINAQLTVNSNATITPTSGAIDTAVSAALSGFKSQAPVSIKFDDTQVSAATTDVNGSLSATFKVPAATNGNHQVTISDQTNTVRLIFNVLHTARMEPTAGFVGTTVSVFGSGFGESREVSVRYDSDRVATGTTDKTGSFTVSFRAPASKGGNHVVTVTDGTTTANFTFVMDSVAPPVPAPVSPAMLTKTDPAPVLDWQDANDQSSVTYTLEIAKDAQFSTIVLQKKGLMVSTYTLSEAEALQSTSKSKPYYWRVKAIDGASNESAWSTPSTFFIGLVVPNWVIFAGLGVIAVLLGVVGYLLGLMKGRRKTVPVKTDGGNPPEITEP